MLYPISEPKSDSVEDRFGYIDGRGNIAVSPSYAACSHFSEGKASAINKTGQSGFIDGKGKLVIAHQFEGLGTFHSGVCAIDGGYISHSGDWVIEPKFLVASPFAEGRAFASTDGENFGFIDFTGRFVIDPGFRPCRHFSEGLAAVCIDDRWGYINRTGKLEIPTVFEGPIATSFRDGIAGVRIDGCWGFIDRFGSFVIKPEYEEVRSFSEACACVRRNGKWGLIDTDGRQVLECQFEELRGLNAGMAPARMNGKAGFVSSAGKWLIEPRFDRCFGFFGDLAVVKLGKAYSYIRRDGEIVWTSESGAPVQYPPPPFLFRRNPGAHCPSADRSLRTGNVGKCRTDEHDPKATSSPAELSASACKPINPSRSEARNLFIFNEPPDRSLSVRAHDVLGSLVADVVSAVQALNRSLSHARCRS